MRRSDLNIFVPAFLSALMFFGAGQSRAAVSGTDSTSCNLSLAQCISLASEGNIKVKNTHLDYMSARMLKNEAFAYYFPKLDFQAAGFGALNPLIRIGYSEILGTSDAANNLKYYAQTLSQMNGVKTTYETLSNAYGLALTLTQPIYAGGRIVNNNRLASLGVKAATLTESIAKRDVGTDVERKYWLAVSLEEKMKVVDAAIKLSDRLYADASSAYASGILTDNEKEEVQLARKDLKAKKVRLKGGMMLSKIDLCNAVGIDGTEASALVLTDRLDRCDAPDSYYRDPSAVAASMEESQLLELAVEQKRLEKKVAMGDALPQVGVGASYSYGHLIGNPQSNGLLFATVKIPLTDWVKTGNKMKNIDYQLQKAANQREYLRSMLELQLRQFWVEVESTWEELQLKEENVAHAKNVFDRTQADFSAGLDTASSLMKKQVELIDAECERIDARIAYRNAVAAFQDKCSN